MATEFKYEVAFSFLTRDESLAQCLNDLLQERMSTFIYPERQRELAGKDGELELKKAFGSDSRLVVILYREEWGTTDWTRIEQDVIRERGYHHGYDFCLLIPLENPPTKPEWFPPHRFWIGLERWGNEAAAAVIEARVRDAGGSTREESLAERKARLERQVLAAEKRKAFLESDNAVQPAIDEAQSLLKKIEDSASALSTKEFPLQSKPEHEGISITSYGFRLHSGWHLAYSNSLTNSAFYLRLLEFNWMDRFERSARELKNLEFHFALNESDRHGWRATVGDKKFFTSEELAEYALRLLLDKVVEFRTKQANAS